MRNKIKSKKVEVVVILCPPKKHCTDWELEIGITKYPQSRFPTLIYNMPLTPERLSDLLSGNPISLDTEEKSAKD
jgi:hypothetical protein